MRVNLKILSVMAFAITALSFIYLNTNNKNIASSDSNSHNHKMIDNSRSIASTGLSVTEAFHFEKIANVKFSNKKESKQKFTGEIFFNWETGNLSKDTAMVMMILDDHQINFPVTAHFTDEYRLDCIKFPENMTAEESSYASLYQGLLFDYAFKTTRDENGEYLSSIEKINETHGVTKLLKTKREYLDANNKYLKIDNSKNIISIEKGLKKLIGEEQYNLTVSYGESFKQLEVNTRVSTLLSRINMELPHFNFKARPYAECTSLFIEPEVTKVEITPSDFSQMLSSVSGLDKKERQKLMRTILLSLKNNPSLLANYMEWVSSILNDKKLSLFAVGILGSLGTHDAQNELVKIFNNADATTSYLKGQVISSFTLMQSVLSADSRAFLKNQASTNDRYLSQGAIYAIGSSIAHSDSSTAANDLSYLSQSLGNATNINEKILYLDALGNSKSSEILSVTKNYLNDSSSLVREKVILNLRSSSSSELIDIYSAALNDASSRVRKAAWNNIMKSKSVVNYSSIFTNCKNISDRTIQKECKTYQ